MVAYSRVKIADAPSRYPLTTGVFTLVDEIEKELDTINDLQDQTHVGTDIQKALENQNKIRRSFQTVDTLISNCREAQRAQSKSGAGLRQTSSFFTSSLDALQ